MIKKNNIVYKMYTINIDNDYFMLWYNINV
jgi:hypothetical protein